MKTFNNIKNNLLLRFDMQYNSEVSILFEEQS